MTGSQLSLPLPHKMLYSNRKNQTKNYVTIQKNLDNSISKSVPEDTALRTARF